MRIQLNDRIYAGVLVALQVVGVVAAVLSTGEYAQVALLAAPLLTVYLRKHAHLVSLGYAVVLSTLSPLHSATLYALATCTVAVGVLAQYSANREPGFVGGVVAPLLLLAPVYIVAPWTLVYPATSLLALLVLTLRTYARISKSGVKVFKAKAVAYVGSQVELPVEITCPGDFKYTVLLDDERVAEGVSVDKAEVAVRTAARVLGVHRKVLRVTTSDVRGVAEVEHDPVVVELNVVPRVSEIARKAEHLVKRYAAYVNVPIIVKGVVSAKDLGAPPEGAGDIGARGRALGPLSGQGLLPGEEYPAPGHEYGTGGGPPRPGAKTYLEVKWHVPLKIVSKVAERLKGYVGEYLGVREYQPGDSLRAIHWKKSLRAEGREDLVVKVYGSEAAEKSAGGKALVVVADLVSPNSLEFDLVLYALYSTLLKAAERAGEALAKVHVYLFLPHGKLYFLQGKVVDVVASLNSIILEEGLRALYEYETWPRVRPVERCPEGFLRVLELYFEEVGRLILKDLEERGVPRGSLVYLVFSRAFSYKYSVIASVLEKAGYSVAVPGVAE